MSDPNIPDKNPSITPITAVPTGPIDNSGGSGVPPSSGNNGVVSMPPFPGGGGSTPAKKSGTI